RARALNTQRIVCSACGGLGFPGPSCVYARTCRLARAARRARVAAFYVRLVTTKHLKLLTLVVLSCALAAPVAAGAYGRPLIVGGSAAAAGSWPSVAYLEGTYAGADGEEHAYACTGSVVAPQWVITAAHCTRGPEGETPDSLTATLGATNHDDPSA